MYTYSVLDLSIYYIKSLTHMIYVNELCYDIMYMNIDKS